MMITTFNIEGVEIKTTLCNGKYEVYWMSDWARHPELQAKGKLASYDLKCGWNASVLYVVTE